MKVLLARPNDFLVDHMRAWCAELGLEPVRLGALSELKDHAPAEVAGLVISAAVTSVIPESPGAALAAARRLFPRHPVLIAGLARLVSARLGLAREFPGATLAGPGEDVPWGQPQVLLYVSSDGLKARGPEFTLSARAHLGLA